MEKREPCKRFSFFFYHMETRNFWMDMGKMESLLAMLQHILHWRHIVSDGGYALVVSEVNVPCFHDYTQSVGRIAALPASLYCKTPHAVRRLQRLLPDAGLWAVLPTEGRAAMMFRSHACQPDVRRSNPASPVGMPVTPFLVFSMRCSASAMVSSISCCIGRNCCVQLHSFSIRSVSRCRAFSISSMS